MCDYTVENGRGKFVRAIPRSVDDSILHPKKDRTYRSSYGNVDVILIYLLIRKKKKDHKLTHF